MGGRERHSLGGGGPRPPGRPPPAAYATRPICDRGFVHHLSSISVINAPASPNTGKYRSGGSRIWGWGGGGGRSSRRGSPGEGAGEGAPLPPS